MVIKNLRLAYRNLLKGKMFSLINISGLSIGFAACILIIQYVNFEFSFEKSFLHYDRLYRIRTTLLENNKVIKKTALSDARFFECYNDGLSEVESYTRLLSTQTWFDCTLRYLDENGEQVTFNEKNLFFADNNFLTLFNVKLSEGDLRSALINPRSIIMTRSAAERYFGKSSPIGKSIRLNGSMFNDELMVTGVMDEMPANSHLENINILVSLSSTENNKPLKEADVYNYVVIKESANLPLTLKKLQDVFEQKLIKKTADASDSRTYYSLDAVKDIYLHLPQVYT